MKHVEYSSKDANLRAMIRQATSEPGMTGRLCEFDADPLLLGVRNGVLDLKSGALLPVSSKVLVSKRCNVAYDPSAGCPRFLRYLEEVQPDAEVRAFLQRFAGYCLTGEVGEKKFLMVTGTGDNGKTVFVELLNWLLGDYARKIETEMLMTHQRNPQGPSADIVALKGRRFVYANETEEGHRLASARVKDMTGRAIRSPAGCPTARPQSLSAPPTSWSLWATTSPTSQTTQPACGAAWAWFRSMRSSRLRNVTGTFLISSRPKARAF
jgi:hypothetical protein